MPGSVWDIFISYSREDEDAAQLSCVELEKAGYRCWLASRDADPRLALAGQIIQTIRESQIVLLFFSQYSNQSAEVAREMEFASEQSNPILSVRLDRTVISNDLSFCLRVAHWHDVSQRGSDKERVADLPNQAGPLLVRRKSSAGNAAVSAGVAARFGDFEILATPDGKPVELGRGGMGVTYRARQVSMGGREVALKVINPELLGDEGVRKRFLREARIAGDIEHPNVALVYALGQEGDSYFYAMQLVDGVDLDKFVKVRGPLSIGQALSVTGQVASALEAAGAKGLIHRDIKPGNIMATKGRRNQLRIKLIDFGLAKNVGANNGTQSIVSGGQFIGTFAFASPEQCKRQELDTRSDLYSLGVTLWFLLTGRTPFRGSPEEVSGSHLFREPPFAELPQLPPTVLHLLKSLLAKDPALRPQTSAELEDKVEELLHGLSAETTVLESDSSHLEEAKTTPIDDSAPLSLIGAPTFSKYLAPAVGQTRDERFYLVEELREGVSGRLFRGREQLTTREVGLKFLHPSIVIDAAHQELVRRQFDQLRSLENEHLLSYYSLHLAAQPPFLVREWLHGFSFKALLRWKQSLTIQELVALLEALPALLDQLMQRSLALVEVSLGKIFLAVPAEIASENFPALAKQPLEGLRQAQLKLNALSLRGLVQGAGPSDSDLTMLSTSRLVALSQTKIGVRSKPPVQLLGRLIYELLSGHPLVQTSGSGQFPPLPALTEPANRMLREACLAPPEAMPWPDCNSFWQAFRLECPAKPASRPPVAAKLQGVPPKPEEARSPKGTKGLVWVIASAIAVALAIIVFALLRSEHFSTPAREAMPAPNPTLALNPAPASSPTLTLTPALTSSSTPASASAANLASTNFEEIIGRADSELKDKQYDKAVADYSEAIRDKPDMAEAYYHRGNAYCGLTQYDKAVADYTQAIVLKPDYPEAFRDRGNAYDDLEQKEKAVADYSEAIRLKPDYADAYENRAEVYGQLKQNEKAIADCTEAIRLKPDDWATYNQRRYLYLGLNQYEKAAADDTEIIRLKPDFAFGYSQRGLDYYNLKQYDKAVADFTDAVRLSPNGDALVLGCRGDAYNGLKQYDKAIADLTEVIRLTPDNAAAYDDRADAYAELKQYDKAIADYTEVIRLKPDDADNYFNRGLAYYNLKQYQNAIADDTEAIRLKPDLSMAYSNRAAADNELKHYDNAIADCTEAIRLDSGQTLAYLNRGNAYAGLKLSEKAIADYTEAIRLKSDFALAYRNRSIVYEQIGQAQRAREDLVAAKKLTGSSPESDRADQSEKINHPSHNQQGSRSAGTKEGMGKKYYDMGVRAESRRSYAEASLYYQAAINWGYSPASSALLRLRLKSR
jgi:serine/threonine protein kinase/regulator of sirC expression with transglutaminase-like and TPR domain